MKTVIIAGGLSTRLRPLTNFTPKPLLEINGKKILDRTLEQLMLAGIDNVILNIGYLSEQFQKYYGDGHGAGLKIEYFLEQELNGTAGAVKKMAGILGDEQILVVYGDNLFNMDFKKIIQKPLAKESLGRIILFDRTKSAYSGIAGGAVVLDEHGMIQKFIEGPESAELPLVNAGAYLLKPEILNYIPEGAACDFGKHLFPLVLEAGKKIEGYVIFSEESVFGIDTLQTLETTKNYYLKNKL